MANNPLFTGRYRLIEEIASGAYGRVYRAVDTSRHDTVVAIKFMQSTRLSSAQERNGFLQEAQFLKMLQHPHILSVLDVGVEAETAIPYIVTEYAPLHSLLDRQKKLAPRPLPQAEAMKVLAQIGSALQYAHRQNIIHRDLKPANILFNAHGDALLADFGIATMLAASIKYGTAIGTPYYMAPEQFRGSISKEGDQYALGCIAYELLTGRLPFTAPDFFALGFKHMSEVPLAPTQLNLLLPRSAEQAILQAMAKQRSDRFPDIASFLLALGMPNLESRPIPCVPPAQAPPAPVHHIAPPTSEPDDQGSATAVYPLISKRRGARPKAFSPVVPAIIPAAVYSAHSRQESTPADTLPRVVEHPPEQGTLASIHAGRPQAPMALRPAFVEETMAPPTMLVPTAEEPPVLPAITSTPPMQLVTARGAAVPFSPAPIAVFPQPTASALPFVPPFPAMPPQSPGISQNASDEGDDSPNPLLVARKTSRSRKPWLLGICLLGILLGGSILYSFLLSAGSAHHSGKSPTIVSITPASTVNIGTTFTFLAVTTPPDASQNQVAARMLSATFSQRRSVAATGVETTPSASSHGTLTFFNDSATSLSFSAGGIYSDRNGVQVTNDTGGIVPAGNPNTTPPTWQAVTVSAHAVAPGSTGNLSKAAINIWKSITPKGSFVVQNDVPFSGGQDAQSYSFLQQTDFAAITNSLTGGIYRDASTALLAALHPWEKLSGPQQCSVEVHFDHPVGSRVVSATASFVAHCTAEAYNATAVQALASKLLQAKRVYSGTNVRHPSNTLAITVLQTHSVDAHGTLALLVDAEALYVYAFSATQKSALASLISGKSRQDALTLLLRQTGVSSVAITGGDGATLSSDPSQITIRILSSV